MEPIKPSEIDKPKNMGEVIERSGRVKREITRKFLNNVVLFVGAFIIFVVILAFTMDIRLISAVQLAELGLAFFVLLLCSYSMYVNCAYGGSRAGKQSDTYIRANDKYDSLKAEITQKKINGRLPEFCRWFIEEELRTTRTAILTEAGIIFDVYMELYVGVDKATLQKSGNLSKTQISAIVAANNVKPIRLTPEMILKRGRGSTRRSPLGMNPHTKIGIKFGLHFVSSCFTSGLMGAIVLDMVADPTWATFAECVLKIFLVVLSGFMGYKMGYENIVVDTVNYMTDQSDLMQQFIHYADMTQTSDHDAEIPDADIDAEEIKSQIQEEKDVKKVSVLEEAV